MASELVSSNDAGERAYIDVDAGEESRRVSPDDIELTVDAWVSPRQISYVRFCVHSSHTNEPQAVRKARLNNGASSSNLPRVNVTSESG